MEQGQEHETFFKVKDFRKYLQAMEDQVIVKRFKDVILQTTTDDCDSIRDTHNRDRAIGLEVMKTSMKSRVCMWETFPN